MRKSFLATLLCGFVFLKILLVLGSQPGCLELEKGALSKFKAGLVDPNNRLASWDHGDDCCKWSGITCDNETGYVVELDLRNPYGHELFAVIAFGDSNNHINWALGGKIDPALQKLKYLRHFDISGNTFNGIPIPDFLGSFKELKYLNISNAGFYGTIPPTIGNLSLLEVLDFNSLRNLDVKNLDWLADLSLLKHLAMNWVDLSLVTHDWIYVMNSLPSLTELHLSICGLSEIPKSLPLVNFTSLRILDLSKNQFDSKFPNWIANISTLVSLDVSRNSWNFDGEFPSGLQRLPHLEELRMTGTLVKGNCSKVFAKGWRNLRLLSLSENQLYGELPISIGNFSSITSLDLRGNLIEGKIPKEIGDLHNLKELQLGGNMFVGRIPEEIGSLLQLEILELRSSFKQVDIISEWLCHLKNLRWLDLSRNMLVGPIPTCSGGLPVLGLINLSYNKLSGSSFGWLCYLKNLWHIDLSNNMLVGSIPTCLGGLSSLELIALNDNKLNGSSLEWLCHLKILEQLDLSSNMLVGPIPPCLGGLSSLMWINLRDNKLNGTILETHFQSLSKLKELDLSSNSLEFQVSPNWDPPFQLESIFLSSCQLGPYFPSWLHSQKYLQDMDLSYTGIGGNIPHFANMDTLILSNNQFSGPIPDDIAEKNPKLRNFLASSNQISGSIPSNLGTLVSLASLDLSKNKLSGVIPSSLGSCSDLKIFDLSNNDLSGNISWPVALLRNLRTLHLDSNKLSGEFPLSLRNCTSLEILDLSDNNFVGSIPGWIGGSLSSLMVLSLRSNMFSGEIPWQLSKLRFLQVLDVANNHLQGSIPRNFGSFAYMKENHTRGDFKFGGETIVYYQQWLVVSMKDQLAVYYNISVSLVVSMDLSNNNFSREIPQELTNLSGLVVLNLSGNHLSGQIPNAIGNLKQLQSLDMSRNQIFGSIPSSIADLTFLSYLNFSHNNLSGRIPSGPPQLQSVNDSSIYAWNEDLCGYPLQKSCPADRIFPNPGLVEGEEVEVHKTTILWFYIGLGQGFFAGFWGLVGLLLFKRSWRIALFQFFDDSVEWLLVRIAVNTAKLQRKFRK